MTGRGVDDHVVFDTLLGTPLRGKSVQQCVVDVQGRIDVRVVLVLILLFDVNHQSTIT